MLKKITMTIAFVALGGCASKYVTLQVHTQPAGAYITQTSGAVLGASPVASQYLRSELKKHRDSTGCALVQGFSAQWVSGATATSEPTIRLCGSHDTFTTTIARSASAPGLDKDLEFALRLTGANAAQRQAGAIEDATGLLFLNLIKP
jgi:hypothetical protein